MTAAVRAALHPRKGKPNLRMGRLWLLPVGRKVVIACRNHRRFHQCLTRSSKIASPLGGAISRVFCSWMRLGRNHQERLSHPCFPPPILTMRDRVGFAHNLNPSSLLIREAIPPYAWRIGKDVCTDPKSVIERRSAALAYLRKLCATLEPANQRYIAKLPRGSPSCGLNFALIHFLATNLKYPDSSLARDLLHGMPLIGQLPASGVFRKRNRDPAIFPEEWRGGLERRNRAVIERIPKCSDPELTRLCWEKSVQEASKGWLAEPVPVAEAAISSIPLTPRFAIWEQHGDSARKIRVVDDAKASRAYDLLGLVDTSIPQNLDTVMGMASIYAHLGNKRKLHAFSVDFANAYKHVGVASDQLEFATVALCNPSGVPMMATLRTQPFGSTRAPANWARITAFVQFVLRKLFQVWMGVFVDDCYAIDPDNTAASAFCVMRELCALIGMSLSPDKEQPPCVNISLLGAPIRIGRTEVTSQLTKRKLDDYIAHLKNVIRRDQLSPAASAKVRRKLGFAQSLTFGKFGPALLHESSARQYSQIRGPAFPLSECIRETIQWWIEALPVARPRSIPFVPSEPAVVYSDAEVSGRCAVVWLDSLSVTRAVCHTHLPSWMLDPMAGIGIFEYELAAVALAVALVAASFPGRPILI